MKKAEQLGAKVAVIYGQDVATQIAEFAHLSQVTTIVIGRSIQKTRFFWKEESLSESLLRLVWDIDVLVVVDREIEWQSQRKHRQDITLLPSLKDVLITSGILLAATLVGFLFFNLGFTEPNIITVYILSVLIISLVTTGYTCSVIASIFSVFLFNFFFTIPRLTLVAYGSGYPVTFIIMLVASIMTGTLAAKLKDQARVSAQFAFRTKVLLDTNQLLQKEVSDLSILETTATQLEKLLQRNIVLYLKQENQIQRIVPKIYQGQDEMDVVNWVFENKQRAGLTTDIFPDAKYLYLAIRSQHQNYGVIGIDVGLNALDSYESGILLSILAECALALENRHNEEEKKKVEIEAENQKLRANLLRMISHDLRTPLTSIAGNADQLKENYERLDATERQQIFSDIAEDADWLTSLVENVLSVTKIEEGSAHLNCSVQLVDDVIQEAIQPFLRKKDQHTLDVQCSDELIMAKMDVRLIIQVLVNLIDNAWKYTPIGTKIIVQTYKKNNRVYFHVKDNGKGLPKEVRDHIFDMFYTGQTKSSDDRRSLGLGLALCKSVVQAHQGSIHVQDAQPHGCDFYFDLPIVEVNIHE